jgi:hypothetical protein
MLKLLTACSLFLCFAPLQPVEDTWLTPYERSGKVATSTWADAISYYKRLDEEYKALKVREIGQADIGHPIHFLTIANSEVNNAAEARAQGKNILFINNAIHPGEPCGVDASMMLARDLLQKPAIKALLDHTVICIIPMYNIGGGLNRGCCSRANQQGPQAYGFRGNARNLDLNRDFVKCDSRNALVFARIFQAWLPDLFIDTHTTNGADYPAHITFIPTMPQKAAPAMASLLHEKLMPHITNDLETQRIPSSVYINPLRWGNPPEQGMAAFPDHPRYRTGYAALFGSMSLVTEAHMLKTFEQRVTATYETLESSLDFLHRNHKRVRETMAQARRSLRSQQQFVLRWELDRSRPDSIPYHGYTAAYRPSKVTGTQQLYYDRKTPFSKNVPYYQRYLPLDTARIPDFYLLPQAWRHVAERLEASGIVMRRLTSDTLLNVEQSYITTVQSRQQPWEGHFYHDEVQSRRERATIQYYAGDYIISTDQPGRAYLVHVLEPESHDSFFRWNFFDEILMQKEWFSAYVFEPEAERMLENDAALRQEFGQKVVSDSAFAGNPFMRLYWLYQRSPHFEKSYRRYPVGRL